MTPFDYTNAITQNKKQLIVDEATEKAYSPFMTNRGLSYFVDCLLHANEMNINPALDKDMQYLFYLNTIRSMKRKFQPWQKSLADKDIEAVKKYFGYSNEKAKEALRILNDEQIADIRTKTEKGGVTK